MFFVSKMREIKQKRMMILNQGFLPLIEHRCDAPFEPECLILKAALQKR